MSPAQVKKEKKALRGEAYFTTHKGMTIPKKGLKKEADIESSGQKKLLVYLLLGMVAYYFYSNFLSV